MERHERAPAREQVESLEVGLIEEILGLWDVKYPGPDYMIREDYVERLELKRDGTYCWNPPPVWAPRRGGWRVLKTHEGLLALCLLDIHNRLRWGYLVVMAVGANGPYYLNWTRTRGDAVIFADRIWRADRPRRK